MSVRPSSSPPAQTPSPSLYLLYHELRPQPSDYSYVVQCARFESHLDLIREVHDAPNHRTLPHVTFDDGHISNYEYALPLLQSRGILAHFFITVGWTGQKPGYMDWPELRSLQQAGHHIGAHGWTHTLLTHCTGKDLEHEISGARFTLEDKLGAPITSMSLPGGRSNARVLDACKAAGYTEIFTSVPRAEPEPLGRLVGRLNIHGNRTSSWIADLLDPASGVLTSLERQYKLKAAAKALLGDRLYANLWAQLNREEPEAEDARTSQA